MSQLRDDYSNFTERDTVVLVIGPEGPASFQRYWKSNHLPFLGLPDPQHSVLKQYGQQIKIFKFGRMPAQAIIDKSPPDLISLDIMMPKESGITLFQKLRRDPKLKNIPVLIVSGMGQEGKLDFYSLIDDKSISEPDGFMEKPIDVDSYIESINELLS